MGRRDLILRSVERPAQAGFERTNHSGWPDRLPEFFCARTSKPNGGKRERGVRRIRKSEKMTGRIRRMSPIDPVGPVRCHGPRISPVAGMRKGRAVRRSAGPDRAYFARARMTTPSRIRASAQAFFLTWTSRKYHAPAVNETMQLQRRTSETIDILMSGRLTA